MKAKKAISKENAGPSQKKKRKRSHPKKHKHKKHRGTIHLVFTYLFSDIKLFTLGMFLTFGNNSPWTDADLPPNPSPTDRSSSSSSSDESHASDKGSVHNFYPPRHIYCLIFYKNTQT